MSLKDWMKKVETSLVNEGTQTIMLPTLKQGSTAPTGEQTAVAIDTSKPGGAVAAAALGAKQGSTTTIANQNSPVKAITPKTDTTNTSTGGTTTQTVGGTTQVSETGLDQVGSFVDEIKVESKPQAGNKESLDRIRKNHPHECKMFEDGWGMDSSLFEALCDQYFEEGRIPRSVWHGSAEGLREFVEDCYAKDTMVLDEDEIDEASGSEDQAVADHMNKQNELSRANHALRKSGTNAVADPLAANPNKVYRREMSGQMELPLDEEMSPLERSLRQSTKEKEMFESKKTRSVQEATEKTKTGLKHKADAGGYGRVDDEEDTDEDGKKIKKVKKDEPKKGRGRPKKTDNASGEDKKFDFGALSKTSGSKAPASDKWDKKKTTSHKIATKADREEIDEGETIEKKGGRVHKGSYGTSHEAGDEGVKKVTTQRGRGRPKKDADDSGEVKNYDWSAFGAKKGVKLPAWDKKKTTSHKIATKADREEVEEAKLKGRQKKIDINKNGKIDGGDFAMLRGQKKKKDAQMESWERQLNGLLTEGMSVSTSTGQAGGEDSVSITATAADAGKLLQILQNAGLSGGAPAQASTNTTSPATGSSGGSAANADLNGSGSAVTSMPMPRGMAFSVQPAETNMPTAPVEVNVSDSEEVFNQLGKDHGQSEKSDNGDDALSFLKKAIGHSTEYADGKSASTTDSTPAQEETEEVEENDEDGKKPDEDGDGVPDWADKKPGKDDSEESDTEEEPEEEPEEDDSEDEEEKVDEGKESCNECGGLMEDDHECSGQLNEWSNSPQGQSVDEQFKTDLEFMQNIISGGLNKKKIDQTVMPHTKVKVTESKVKNTASAYTLELKKLAGI